MATTTVKPQLKLKSIEPDTYHGELHKIDNWLYSLEQFFTANELDFEEEDEKKCAAIAGALLRDTALQWHKRLHRAGTLPQTYSALKVSLIRQFGLIDEERKARDILYELRQTNSVQEYVTNFENVVQHLDTAHDDELRHKFVHGLKPKIRQAVLIQQPAILNEAIQYALTAEDITYSNMYTTRILTKGNIQSNNQNGQNRSQIVPMELGKVTRLPKQTKEAKSIQQLTQQVQNLSRQMEQRSGSRNNTYKKPKNNKKNPQRRDATKARCYTCGGVGHYSRDCANNRKDLNNLPKNEESSSPNSQPYDILLDSGATDSYIPQNIVRANNWIVQDKKLSTIRLPSGQELNSTQRVKLKVNYNPSKASERITFHILPIQGTIILGGDWIRGNKVIIDYARSSLLHQGLQKKVHIPIYATPKYRDGIPPNISKQTNTLQTDILEPVYRMSYKSYLKSLRKKDHFGFLAQVSEIKDSQNTSDHYVFPQRDQEVISNFLTQQHDKLEQFKQNTIYLKQTQIKTKVTTLANTLYLDSQQGREPFGRMYQRTEFHLRPQELVDKRQQPYQILSENKIYLKDLKYAKEVFTNKNTLFLFNKFYLTDKQIVEPLKLLLATGNCLNNSILVNNAVAYTEEDSVAKTVYVSSASPMDFVKDHMDKTKADLPEGAAQVLEQANIEDRGKIQSLLQEFKSVFPSDLPFRQPPDRQLDDAHKIELVQDAKVPSRRLYKTSPAEQLLIKQQITELLDCGFIRPSSSPFGSPVLFVKKPDGSLRFCIDYRAVNAVTQKDRYPLPTASELMDQLSGATYFSSLDLRSGYWQLKMRESDVAKTAFLTRYGQFEWLVMPFGLTNAPATFQRVMHNLLNPFLDRFVVVYLDDILIYSKTASEHESHVRQILQKLSDNQFFCKLKKCELFKRTITFLGHQIDSEGIHIDANKIASIKDWPECSNVQTLQRFLGFANWFRKFIRNFSTIASPLTDLLKADTKWIWSDTQRDAFNLLKTSICEAPCLHIIDYSRNEPLEIHTDASNHAISGILYQKVGKHLKVCAFHSRRLKPAEKNYSTTDREMLAIVDTLRHWRHYVQGLDFIVKTDHAALQYFFSQPNLSPRQIRWLETLSDFQPGLKIHHQPGTSNVPADNLSRRPDYCLNNILKTQSHSTILPSALQELQKDQDSDSSLHQFRQIALKRSTTFQIYKGVLYRGIDATYKTLRPVLPESWHQRILEELHDNYGHFGIQKTMELISTRFWFPKMSNVITQYVRRCDICQRQKPSNQKPMGLLQPLNTPKQPWTHISMDFVTDLPTTNNGYNMIFSIIDRFSKMAHFIPMKMEDSGTETIATLFFNNIVKLHGLPLDIVSDRDKRFTSQFWRTIMKMCRTNISLSSAYHPQSDGQTERVHRTIEQLLRNILNSQSRNWFKFLNQIELFYNSVPSAATGKSPMEIVYGRRPILPIDLCLDLQVPAAASFASELHRTWQQVTEAINSAKQLQSRAANRHRRPAAIAVGSLVLLSTKHLKLKGFSAAKLAPRFVGPFPVVARVGTSFKLGLPPEMAAVHPVFHASLLKEYTGTLAMPPGPLLVDDQAEYEVDSILSHRYVQGHKREFLVRWKGYDDSSNTWLPESELSNCLELLAAYLGELSA